MTKSKLLAIIVLLYSIQISAQQLKPSETHSVIQIQIVGENDTPLVEEIELVSKKNGGKYKGTSNDSGKLELLVPINSSYILNMSEIKNYDTFEVPNNPYYTIGYMIEYVPDMHIATGKTLFKLQIKNTKGDVLTNEQVTFINQQTKKEYIKTTNTEGKLSLQLPYNSGYSINFLSAPDYERFQLDKEENVIIEHQLEFDGSGTGKFYPSLKKGLLVFKYIDLDNKPVPNEELKIISIKGKKTYNVKTNKEGKAHLLVPLGDKYTFSAKYFKDFQRYSFPDTLGLMEVDVKLKAISSAEFEKRKKDREEKLRIRDSIYSARKVPLEYNSLDHKLKRIKTDVSEAKKNLKKSPKYFENIKSTVNAVLYRHKTKWGNKIIITDATGSMDKYLHQVYLWHALKANINSQNEYIFFNDGDDKAQYEKIIGKTEGFHYTNSEILDSIITKCMYAKSITDGGDSPENDFEAILEAIQYRNNREELILIADNYSDVRDYGLLDIINVPVRVILCGVHSYVNEQYLDLAYKTKGSVHSIEEDLNMLRRISLGSEITFRGKTYVYTKAGFIYKR